MDWWIQLLIGVGATVTGALILSFVPPTRSWVRTIVRRQKLNRRIEKVGISNFYTSRDDYAFYRSAPKLVDYLSLANREIYVCAHWMAHGTEMEGIANEIAQLTKPPKRLKITIAIVSPTNPSIPSLADFLNMDRNELERRIRKSLDRLQEEKNKLAEEEKRRFVIKTYDSLPVASVIMLDPKDPECRLQFDVKAYRKARQYSFGFEVRNKDAYLLKLLSSSWLELIENSEEYNPASVLNPEDRQG